MNIGFQTSGLSGFTRVAYLWRRHASAVLWIAMAALLPTACSDDAEQSVPQANGHTAVIYLNFKTGASKQAAEMNTSQSSETRAPLTRAIDENGINTVDVLSFKVDPADPTNIKKGTFFYRAQGVYDAATQSVCVRLVSDAAAQTLVVLANVRQQIDAFPAAYGEQKETVMGRLLLPATSDKMPDLTSGMPMWGELPVQTINETYAQSLMTAPTVTMIRSLVKVTIENKVSAVIPPYWGGGIYDSFVIRAHPVIYNYRANGRISPDNFNVTAQTVFAPTIPTASGTVLPQGTHLDNPPWQEWEQLFPGSKTYIYLFEMNNSSAISSGSALDGCCLVVYGSSNDPHYSANGYYRIDLKDYDTNTYFDLKRNYEYRIQILEIPNNPGAPSPDEAFKGNYTLKCKIVPWNEVQEEVIVPGNKRLTVDKREFVFPGDPNVTGETGGSQLLTLSTENTGGWRIEGKPDWISLSQTTGGDNTPATVTLTVSGVNPGRTDRTATMNLVAGNLTYKIHLSQPDACGKNGVPKKMRIGNNDYYTHRFGGQCWMLENSREGTPSYKLPPLPGKVKDRYLYKGTDLTSSGVVSAGWRIPNYTDFKLLKEAMNTASDKAIWFDERWREPGLRAYFPTFVDDVYTVQAWPGRSANKFYHTNPMRPWQNGYICGLSGYEYIEQNAEAFWTKQLISDPSMYSGAQAVPSHDGTKKAHVTMSQIPVLIQYQEFIPCPLYLNYLHPSQRNNNFYLSMMGSMFKRLTTYQVIDKITGGTYWYSDYIEQLGNKTALKVSDWQWSGATTDRIFYYGDMPWYYGSSNKITVNDMKNYYNHDKFMRSVVGSLTNNHTWVHVDNTCFYVFKVDNSRQGDLRYETSYYNNLNIMQTPYLNTGYVPRSNISIYNGKGLFVYLENELQVRCVRIEDQ